MTTRLRLATAQDVPFMAQLARLTGVEGWHSSALTDALSNPSYVAWVVEAHAPFGFSFMRTVADESELLLIAVDPARQNQGWGARLLAEVLIEATRRTAVQVHLEVEADNQAAERLYTRFGFVPVGTRPRYYASGADARLFRWTRT